VLAACLIVKELFWIGHYGVLATTMEAAQNDRDILLPP